VRSLRSEVRRIVVGVVVRGDNKNGSGVLGMIIELASSLSFGRFERPNN
jgi:hypothetical protein